MKARSISRPEAPKEKQNPADAHYLLELLRCSLTGRTPSALPAGCTWRGVYAAAERNSVSLLALEAAKRLNEPIDPPILSRWERKQASQLVQAVNQDIALRQLSALFAQNRIPHAPLKGAVLRALYPMPEYREMCDLDILIPESQRETAERLVLAEGFRRCDELTTSHNREYLRAPLLSIELHTAMTPKEDEAAYRYYSDVWERLRPTGRPYCYALSHEDHYVYLLSHMEKHYYNSGIGIRYILDLYLYRRKLGGEMDWAYVERELKKLRLSSFAQFAETLADAWFSEEARLLPARLQPAAEAVLCGGVYGTQEGAATSAIRKQLRDGKTRRTALTGYFLRRFFPTPEDMYAWTPVLRRVPILLPFCWVYRWGVLLFRKPWALRKHLQSTRDAKKALEASESILPGADGDF